MEITGRLTANAEVKETKTEKKVTRFTIAMNHTYMQNGERKTITTYVDCSYWINSGVAEYLKKGALVQLYGNIDVNAWIDKEGNAKGRITLHTQTIKILAFAAKKDEDSQPAEKETTEKTNGKKAVTNSATDDDDLPF